MAKNIEFGSFTDLKTQHHTRLRKQKFTETAKQETGFKKKFSNKSW